MEKREYPYIDMLHLIGGLDEMDAHLLKINNRTCLRLDRRMFLVLLVLFCHGLQSVGKKVPLKVATNLYLSAQMILDPIEDFLKDLANLSKRPAVFLNNAIDQNIINTIDRIRRRLDEHGFHRNFIGRGPNNRGYAWNVPPQNLRLSFIDPRDGSIWEISGSE